MLIAIFCMIDERGHMHEVTTIVRAGIDLPRSEGAAGVLQDRHLFAASVGAW